MASDDQGAEAPPQELFHQIYEGQAPWDIGRPQPAFEELVRAGEIKGDVIDLGCGTGEHVLLFAANGHAALGLDMVEKAIGMARAKAAARGIAAQFEVGNALELDKLGRSFDTVTDSGLFHVFDDTLRARYVASLRQVLRPGGRYFMLVFSDQEPLEGGGPRRVSQAEIHQAFAEGFRVLWIRPAQWVHLLGGKGYAEAWLAAIERTG
jgi:SAM-dependent methyltransferase